MDRPGTTRDSDAGDPFGTEFAADLSRVTAGDEAAAERIVARYEPEIRRFVRFRLTSPHLRRVVESVDISQSVFRRFFVDVRDRGAAPHTPDDLKRLLLTIAKNRLTDHVRHEQAAKRDARRLADGSAALAGVADAVEAPEERVAREEALEAVRGQMSGEEFDLVNERLAGASWASLAAGRGSTADAVRKQVGRIFERVAERLGGLS